MVLSLIGFLINSPIEDFNLLFKRFLETAVGDIFLETTIWTLGDWVCFILRDSKSV